MKTFEVKYEHLIGFELLNHKIDFPLDNYRCLLKGKDKAKIDFFFPIDDELFSKHLLFLGNIGTGKTNAISQILQQVESQMTEDDVMIIFDSKGDFYERFYHKGDVVFTNNSTKFLGSENKWNIFSELCIDGTVESIKENAFEIASVLFFDKIKKTQQPFFPQAAKDIFASILEIFAINNKEKDMQNESLINYLLDDSDINVLKELFSERGYESINSYIAGEDSLQAVGVISELYQLLREIFVGDFSKKGSLSIRKLIREKGKKKIFIEYDMAVGSMLTPVYRLLLDLAIKESLGRSKSKGNVWFFIDEFRLVPNLKHLDDGINFGRSQGAKFIIGIQNIPQVYKEYGEPTAQSLLSGLSTVFSFRVDDYKSREFIQNRYGASLKKLVYMKSHGDAVDDVKNGKVIEDWDISGLGLGEAIVGLPGENPFIFKFEEFKPV